MTRFNKNRYKNNWVRARGYVAHYISEGTAKNIKNASFATLSFLGGFIFYQSMLREIFAEKDCDCYCSRPQQKSAKKSTKEENPEEAEIISKQ